MLRSRVVAREAAIANRRANQPFLKRCIVHSRSSIDRIMVRLITPLILILPALIFAEPPEDDLSAGSASSGPLYSNRSLQDQDAFLNRKRIRDTIIQALATESPTESPTYYPSYVPTFYPTISNYPSTSPSTRHSPSSSPSISQLPTVSTIPSAKPTMTQSGKSAKGGNNFVDGSKVGKVGKGDKASKTSTNDDGSGGNSFVDGSKSSKTYSNDEEEDDDIVTGKTAKILSFDMDFRATDEIEVAPELLSGEPTYYPSLFPTYIPSYFPTMSPVPMRKDSSGFVDDEASDSKASKASDDDDETHGSKSSKADDDDAVTVSGKASKTSSLVDDDDGSTASKSGKSRRD